MKRSLRRSIESWMRGAWRVACAAALLAPAALAGQTWQVGPGGDFTSLAAATAAAADGDVVIVHSTPLDAATIDGKGLTLIAPLISSTPGSKPKVGPVDVRGLAPGQQLVVRGLQVTAPLFTPGAVLHVDGCVGAVRIEDCDIEAPTSVDDFDPSFGVHVERSRDVTFTRCTLSGGPGNDGVDVWPNPVWPTSGASAAHVLESTVAFFGCVVSGGHGGTPWADIEGEYGMSGGNGGAALEVVDSSVVVTGSQFSGAGGGWYTCDEDGNCGSPGSPGYGIANSTSQVWIQDCTVKAGSQTKHATQEPVKLVEGTHRSLAVSAAAFPGGTVELECVGLPGDAFVAFGGLLTDQLPFQASVGGVILLAPPLGLGPYLLPQVGPQGDPVSLAFAAPGLAASVEGISVHFQGVVTVGADLLVTSLSTLTLVRP